MTEWDAGDYHRQSNLQRAMADEVLRALTLAGTERVLDVGCGDGKVTAAIAARVPGGSVVGVDPSRQMIAFAAEHFGPANHPNLRFEVGDARRLPFRGEFDLVVSFNALHWVPEQDAALRSIRAALRPGGRALLRFVPESERPSLEDTIEAVCLGPRWVGYFPGYRRPFAHFTPDEYRAMAEAAGFRVDRITPIDLAWDFGSREAFMAFCRVTFVEWTSKLPEGDREAFIGEVLDRYRSAVAATPADANKFKTFQMVVELTNPGGPAETWASPGCGNGV